MKTRRPATFRAATRSAKRRTFIHGRAGSRILRSRPRRRSFHPESHLRAFHPRPAARIAPRPRAAVHFPFASPRSFAPPHARRRRVRREHARLRNSPPLPVAATLRHRRRSDRIDDHATDQRVARADAAGRGRRAAGPAGVAPGRRRGLGRCRRDARADGLPQSELARPRGQAAVPARRRPGRSSFALDVDGKLRAAVPVEKARAQQVFEDIARRRVDPGLLQTTIGNNYKLRVYPLLPGKTRTRRAAHREPRPRRLQVPSATPSASTQLALSLRVPGAASAPELIGAGALGLRFEPQAAGGFVARSTRHDVALPSEPLGLRLPARREVAIATEERDGQSFFTLELPVPQRPLARPLPQRVQIVWDASGSARPARSTASSRCSTPTSRRARDTSVAWSASPTPRGADPLRGSRGDWTRPAARARVDGLRRRQQPRRGPPRRRLGRGALVQRRPRQLRRAVAARLPRADVRDQQRRERRPAAPAGARRRERRAQHRPRDDDAPERRRRAAAARQRSRVP